FVLVHSRERILPELGDRLAGYASGKLVARGIELRLGVPVAGADAGGVDLSDGERLQARTLVWAAGTRPSAVPLVTGHPEGSGEPRGGAPVDRRGSFRRTVPGGGAVAVDRTLRVRGTDDIWAVGDCARVPDLSRRGPTCPPNAQPAGPPRRAAPPGSRSASAASGSWSPWDDRAPPPSCAACASPACPPGCCGAAS